MSNTPEERLNRLQQQQKSLQDKIRREKAKLAGEERKRETRRKVLIGATLMKVAEDDVALKERITLELDKGLKRPDDRALFGFEPQPANDGGGESEQSSVAS